MRSLGRFFLTSGFSTFPINAGVFAQQFLGPLLTFPLLSPTSSLRIVSCQANISDAAISGSLTVLHASMALVAKAAGPNTRLRQYELTGFNTTDFLGKEGIWWSRADSELVKGTDYRELISTIPAWPMGAFAFQLEFEGSNGGAANENFTVNLSVLFELFQGEL